jgi:hypothetical protein
MPAEAKICPWSPRHGREEDFRRALREEDKGEKQPMGFLISSGLGYSRNACSSPHGKKRT